MTRGVAPRHLASRVTDEISVGAVAVVRGLAVMAVGSLGDVVTSILLRGRRGR
jgi:hypothetical protein